MGGVVCLKQNFGIMQNKLQHAEIKKAIFQTSLVPFSISTHKSAFVLDQVYM